MNNNFEQNKKPEEKFKEKKSNSFEYLTIVGLILLLVGFLAFLFLSHDKIPSNGLYILVGVFILIIILGLIFMIRIIKEGERYEPDYRAFFIIGITWLPFGIIIKNSIFWIMGLVFTIVGLVNKDKWKKQKSLKELDPFERKTRILIMVILGVLVLIGCVLFFFASGLSDFYTTELSKKDGWIFADGEWVGTPSGSKPQDSYGNTKGKECTFYSIDECPIECVVCPPCMECSSISCQSEDFCAEMGIDRSWYDDIQKKISHFEIRLETPRLNQKISSPLVVEGEARGTWFFEGDFPVILTNWDGLIISEGIAKAQGDWMRESFVKFRAELEFDKPEYSDKGTLILRKDNPSGLPENDDAFEVSVIFE